MSQTEDAAPSPILAGTSRVRVEIHPYDWSKRVDPDAVVAGRISAGRSAHRKGYHYLNPVYTVSASDLSEEFLEKISDVDGRWSRQCQAYPLEDVRMEQRRRFRLAAGDFGKLFAGGRLLPRLVFRTMAEDITPSLLTSMHPRVWRNPDLDSLARTGDPEPLRTVVRQELSRLVEAVPHATAYVTPGFTVTKADVPDGKLSLRADHFLGQARECQRLWKKWIDDILGKARRKELKAAADPATLMMVYLGTLVVRGQAYLPWCWPDAKVTEMKLQSAPFQLPTVPLEYPGLKSLP